MRRQIVHRLLPLLALLVGVALRLIQLGDDSLWYDETVSVTLAGSPFSELLRHTAADIHPPGYYVLLRTWLMVMGYPTGQAGASGCGLEFASAFFSLGFGALLIALTYTLTRRLAGEHTSLLAATLVALSPYNIWYSQEVRMYTLGATWGLLALYFLMRILGPAGEDRLSWWTLYAVAAAGGLYTLYYFVFLLVPLNLWVAWRIFARDAKARKAPTSALTRWRAIGRWSGANLLALLLYLPWLPIAWRQATEPPVPPWRTAQGLLEMLTESWTALTFGQSAPTWAAVLGLVALPLYIVGLVRLLRRSGESAWILPIATFGALASILIVSALAPLFHIRYLFTFCPAFYIVLAAGIGGVFHYRRALGLVAAAAWLAGAGMTLNAFWKDPAYRADDHRSAVRALQDRWRPGDVVLVNAGYVYPALRTYWAGETADRIRLTAPLPAARADAALVMVTSGHINGEAGLGWGDPLSDFFPISSELAKHQIDALYSNFSRVWHYRVYDTVNDPSGVLRQLLEEQGRIAEDLAFSGEANMRLQAYVSQKGAEPGSDAQHARFESGLTLYAEPVAEEVYSGSSIYPVLHWATGADARAFATSLRLVSPDGEVWSQPPDVTPLGELFPAASWPSGCCQRQTMALPVPEGTMPGGYSVELVVYDPEDGRSWTPTIEDSGLALGNVGIVLGSVDVLRDESPSFGERTLASFGPLRLLSVDTPVTSIPQGSAIPVEMQWQASETPGEPLVIVVQLLDSDKRVAASLEEEPVRGRYPSTDWAAGEKVRDRHTLEVPQGLAEGKYRLVVGVYRASDGERLRTRSGWLGSSDTWTIREIVIQADG